MKQEIEKIRISRPDIKLKGISLFISILFHILLLFLLVKIFPPVRLYVHEEVAEVHIVSPEEIYLPRIDRYLEEAEIPGALPQERPMGTPSAVGEEGSIDRETEQGQVYLPDLSINQTVSRAEEDQSFSGMVSEFRLDAFSGRKSNFTLGVGREKSEPTDRVEGEPKERLNISGYYSDGLSSIQFNRMKSRKGAGGIRTSRQQQSEFMYSESFDISPWVKEVVDKIRNNWSIPPPRESVAIGEVKILIVVGKDGRLITLEILDSSDLPLFDEMAMEAIRLSSPFPPLPEGFPYESFEASLVFQFNE